MNQKCKYTRQTEQKEQDGSDRKLRIYICSPFRPKAKTQEMAKKQMADNLDRAKTACKLVADLGAVPICSHLFCTQFLDDNIESERKQGMALGLEMLKDADELWCFSELISEGMAVEITEASRFGIPVRMFCESVGLLGKMLGVGEDAAKKSEDENDEENEEDDYE